MNIIYSGKAISAIERMDKATKQRIRQGILKLPKGDVKLLHGRKVSTYRLRIGGWRILFSYHTEDTIQIEKIAPRGQAYKGG